VRIANAVVKYVLFFNALLSASQFSFVSLKFLELSSMSAWFWVRGEKRKEFAGDVENSVVVEGFVLLK